MRKTKYIFFIITSIIAIKCCSTVIFANEVLAQIQNSLVVIISRTPVGMRAGDGFVIGDGTLVVTAHHVAFEKSEQGQHEMAGLVTIFSPYIGEGCDAEIIAADKDIDIAILKASWQGHPALKLTDDQSIIQAEKMDIIGMPAIIRGLSPDANFPLPGTFEVQLEKIRVNFVATRQQNPLFISLSGAGQLGDGWSGSPMLLPGTSNVAGCFVRLRRSKEKEIPNGEGTAITQVRRLLDKAGETKLLDSAKGVVPKPTDSNDIFFAFLRAHRYFAEHKYELAYEETQTLIRLRPKSVIAQRLAATVAEKQGKYDLAGQYYQKALGLNSEGTALKIFYTQYLSEREPDKALSVLNDMWKTEGARPFLAFLMFNILSERHDYQKCEDLLNEALKINPNNAYLWFNLGVCQLQLNKAGDAVTSIEKAVELLPERGPFRGQLARLLEKSGKFDQAEKHFRELLKVEPNNPVVHMWLAKFLAEHRPSANEEALKEAQIALKLPVKSGLSKETIEQFIHDLQSKPERKSTE